jgi:hypothetical protein
MPLVQSASKKVLSENIGKEINAGKDPKQAAAIAYSVKRQNDNVPVCEMVFNSNLPLAVSARQTFDENKIRNS